MEMGLTAREIMIKDDMERELGFHIYDPNMLTSDGETPLMLVNIFNDDLPPIFWNPIIYTKLLIKMGANPNIINPELGTALHFATTNDFAKIVKYLLSVGANPFVKDGDGKTPYDLAVHYGNTETINILKDHMIRKIQNKQLRRMTRKRAKTMRRLATAKSMLRENNPMSHMDYDTMSYLMSNYLM
jgi:ankyrin repeat protein